MYGGQTFTQIRRATQDKLARGLLMLQRGDYTAGETMARETLTAWRCASAPRQEEAPLVVLLGKCLTAQKRYEEAAELYIQALAYLTGEAYDEVYTNFLYLNERMGTFAEKSLPQSKNDKDHDQNIDCEPNYSPGYYDDFNK